MILTVLPTIQQWCLFSGVVFAVGCVAWRWVIWPGAERASPSAVGPSRRILETRVAASGIAAASFLLAIWILKMVLQVAAFRDPFVPLWDDVSFLLFSTFWGTVWMAQGVLIPLLVAAFTVAARNASRAGGAWAAAATLTMALVATLALSSHAVGVDSGRTVAVVSDGLHGLAAGGWIGSLAVILVASRSTRISNRDALVAAQLRSFSPLAIGCVSCLIAMGVILAWFHLTAVSDLWITGYGRVLVAKVALAGLVFGLGFVNWRRGLLVLNTTEGARSVRRRATLEVGLASGVLMLTALLTHSVKP